MRGLKTTIIDIYKKLTTYDKSIGIITNGVDNLYPERVDRFINNSVTAKTCAKIMATYLTGNGFGEDNDKKIVNSVEKTTLQKFTSQIARNISKQRGVFIHVKYNLNFKPDSYKVLPYNSCRLGKKDDNKYNGKIGVSDDWENANLRDTNVIFIDVFNNDEKVVENQINSQTGDNLKEKLEQYKGQILYFNLDDEYIYALSQVDSVLKDCDSEAQASLYKNRSLRKGYMGQKAIVTKPLADSIDDYDSKESYHIALSERDNFIKTFKDSMGAENQGGINLFEMQYENDSLDDLIKIIDIDSGITDDTFKHTEESVFNNILMAFNSIPSGLVRPVNTLFGTSGDAINQMKVVYQDNTTTERNEMVQLIQFLMSIFKEPLTGLELELLVDDTKQVEEEPKKEEDDTTD